METMEITTVEGMVWSSAIEFLLIPLLE